MGMKNPAGHQADGGVSQNKNLPFSLFGGQNYLPLRL